MASKSPTTTSDYVDSAQIKWARSAARVTSKQSAAMALAVESDTDGEDSSTGLSGPKKSAMKKQNRQHFGGALLNDEISEGHPVTEYPGMHVKRRSERFGSNASTYEQLPGTSTRSQKRGNNSHHHLSDSYKLTCMDRLICRYLHPKIAFFYAVDGVKRYMHALDKEWSPILKLFEWPNLPGGQHAKARGYNYVTHSLWIISYAAGTAYSTDDDKEEFYREYFEKLVIKGETLGIRLQEFVKPVNALENMFDSFTEMAKIMDVNLVTPAYFGVDPAEIFGEAIIPDVRRYRIRDYLSIKIYTRDVQDMEWIQFRDLRFREQMTRVQNGLSDLLAKIDIIYRTLPSVLKIIKAAPGKSFTGHPILLPHIMAMKNNLKTLFRSTHVSSEEEKLIKTVFEKTQENVQYIIEQAIFAIINIWEVILMTRLAYKYVLGSPNSCGTMISMNELLKRLPRVEAQLSANVQYKWKQFYDVNCASLLRKVPVFIRNTVEVAIHLDGFSNPEAQISAKRSVAPINVHSKKSLNPGNASSSESTSEIHKELVAKSEPNTRSKSKVKING